MIYFCKYDASTSQHGKLLYDDTQYLLALALADKAFWGIGSVEDFWKLQIPPDESERILRWTDAAKCLLVLRNATMQQGVSEQPLLKKTFDPIIKSVLNLSGYFGNATLSCSLTIISPESCPPFEALSYVWGQAKAVHLVLCDGGVVSITQDLDDALRSLRLPTQARRLWVDAVCIDQQNIDERSRQVQYMRLIYSRATRVMVWLGLKVPGLEKAMDLAETLHDIRSSDRPDETTGAVNKVELIQNVSMLALATLTAEEEAAKNLQALQSRDFFSRSWYIRKVLVSAYCVAKI